MFSLWRYTIKNSDSDKGQVGTYSIGAVVKLSGLTSDNIRVWEKRHGAVVANRLPSGRRYYTQAQVNRLLLLKQCIICGFSISELAKLDDAELQEKIASHTPKKIKRIKKDEPITVGILSQSDLIKEVQNIPKINIILSEILNDFSKVHLHDQLLKITPDILVLEVSGVNAQNVKSIIELSKLTSPTLLIVIYRFGNQAHLGALRNQGFRLLRAPLDDESLFYLLSGFISNHQWLEESTFTPVPNQYPAHLYTHQQLSKIANLPTKVDCECPHHLVDLIVGLKEFEKYSGECINKNDEDAALHGKIQLTTASSRQQLENLLREVLSIEGIEI